VRSNLKIDFMKKSIISLCIVLAMLSMATFIGCDTFLKIVTVRTLQYSNLTSTSVVLRGEVASTGGNKEVSERGFFYGTSKNLKNAESVECGHGGKGEFEATINGLQPNTKYYYQAYAKGDDDLDVGDVMEFTTFELNFVLETGQPDILSLGTVRLNGSYQNNENLNIEKVGFEYAKNGNFTNATVVYAERVQTPFSVIVDLDDATYYYRSLVQAEDSTIILTGEPVVFASVNHDAPVVTTANATEITSTSALLSGSVSGGEIGVKGFYWSTSSDFSNPTQMQVGSGLGTGVFSGTLRELSPSTTYYYKAYVTYSNLGSMTEVLGEMKSFTTEAE